MTERKGVSRCIAAARAFLRVIQDHVQNGGLVRDVAVWRLFYLVFFHPL
jgi:hypothetical protein